MKKGPVEVTMMGRHKRLIYGTGRGYVLSCLKNVDVGIVVHFVRKKQHTW